MKNENKANGNETCEIYMNEVIKKKCKKGLKIILVCKLKQEKLKKMKKR